MPECPLCGGSTDIEKRLDLAEFGIDNRDCGETWLHMPHLDHQVGLTVSISTRLLVELLNIVFENNPDM